MKRLLLPCTLVLMLAACAGGPGMSSGPSLPPLAGSEWMLRDMGGTPVVAESDASLAFMDGERANGSGSCNRFTATYTLGADGALRFGPIATTRRACPGPVSEQEARYIKALEAAERAAMRGGELLVYSRGMSEPLRFTRKPA